MIRAAAVLLVCCALLPGQSTDSQRKFLDELAWLESRRVGPKVDPLKRIQEDLNFSSVDAEALLAAARGFHAEVEPIEQGLKRATLDRRMQVLADTTASTVTEAELLTRFNERRELVLASKMKGLRLRLGDETFSTLMKFIEARSQAERFFTSRPGEKGVSR